MTMELATLSDVMTLGEVLAKSGFFQDARGAAQAVVKVLAGRELGFGPIASMTGVHIVKGKPVMSATLMAAAVQRSKKYRFRVTEMTDKACKIVFYEGQEQIGESSFTMDDAKKAGLGGNPTWTSFPRNMLYARALSNGARWYTPEIFGGPVYTPDELGIDVDGETGEVRHLSSVTIEEPPAADVKSSGTKGGTPQTSAHPIGSTPSTAAPVESSPGSLDQEPPFNDQAADEERKELERRISAQPPARVTILMRRLELGDGDWRKLDIAALNMLANHLDKRA